MITFNLLDFYQVLEEYKPLMGIDYGINKIGIAISDPKRSVASPLSNISSYNSIYQKLELILSLIKKHSICGIVLGFPLSMNSKLNQQTKIVERFAKFLLQSCNLPIYLQDERLTSLAANNLLKCLGLKRKKRNSQDDAVAASILLESALFSMLKL